MPCNRPDLRDVAGIQKRICGTAERGPDIESNNKFSRWAEVTGARCIHDGNRSEETNRVCSNVSILPESLSIPLGPATLFLYRTEMKGRLK